MAEETIVSMDHFQQLWNRQNELRRKNTAELRAAVRRGDIVARRKLSDARIQLTQIDRLIEQAERAFLATNRQQSDAEKRLMGQAREANKLVRSINTVNKLLDGIAKFSSLVQRLITILP